MENEFEGVRVSYDLNRLRLLGKLVVKPKGDADFSTDQTRAFVLLHGPELEDRLQKTVRDFMKEKL